MRFVNLKKEKGKSADYICSEIEHIIKTYSKRDPGSEGEHKASEYMAEELKKYSDDVKIEDFKVNPDSFYGWIPITVTLMLMAVVMYFFMPIISAVLLAVGVIIMLVQFVSYRKLIDKLFKEKISCNVTAIKKPTGEVKRRIFFNGHPDAANEWTMNYHFGGKVMSIQVMIAFFGVVYAVAIIAVAMIMQGVGFVIAKSTTLYLGLAGLIFVPFWISIYGLSNKRIIVDGANDNLTGCYLGIAILKALKENNITFENTEVGVLLTGSEEAGLRGAKAWAKEHKHDYDDVETVIIAYDTIRESKFLSVNVKDLNATVKTDEALGNLFMRAAKNVGATCSFGSVPIGATDSAAFTQGGFRSIGITAMDHNLKDYYHTRRDTYDNLDKDCLATTFEVSAETLDLFDKGEIDI
ncbi:MAG TPA: M20/M25/M40 family metallo-hydrolase [Clostridia bacterium]|nr:M20/M25/M40 family metallo-hydrolase [Clostridia bacterium]